MKEGITFISTDLDQFGKKLKLVIALQPSFFNVVKSRKSIGQDHYIYKIWYAITKQKINNIVFIVPL